MCLAETLVISVAVDSDHLGEMLYQVVFSVHLTCVVVHVDVLKERLLVQCLETLDKYQVGITPVGCTIFRCTTV